MKKLIALLLVSTLVGCKPASVPGSGGSGASGSVAADYYATFEGDNLGCCIVRDLFHHPAQALVKGRANVGETAVWSTKDNALQMTVTAPPPAQIPTDADGNYLVTPSMGVFGTGYNFGPGTAFTVSATFQRPVGAPSGKAWSVGVVGRTGGVDDSSTLKRIVLSFRVCTTGVGGCKNAKVNLRVLEVDGTNPDYNTNSAMLASTNITDAVYDAIFNHAQPFTLKLFLDRKAGSGTATITTGSESIPPLTFNNLTIFKADAGTDPITTVGATLANGFALGETVSVEATDFKIWGRPSASRVPLTTPSQAHSESTP